MMNTPDCKGLIYRAYTSNVMRQNNDVQAARGLRYQKNLSCGECDTCQDTLDLLRDFFWTTKKSLGLDPRQIKHGHYYQVKQVGTDPFAYLTFAPVEITIPNKQLEYQEGVIDD